MFCLVNRMAEGIVYMYLASELICQEEIWEGDLERKHIRDKQTTFFFTFLFEYVIIFHLPCKEEHRGSEISM